jgi:hypothetical protein
MKCRAMIGWRSEIPSSSPCNSVTARSETSEFGHFGLDLSNNLGEWNHFGHFLIFFFTRGATFSSSPRVPPLDSPPPFSWTLDMSSGAQGHWGESGRLCGLFPRHPWCFRAFGADFSFSQTFGLYVQPRPYW